MSYHRSKLSRSLRQPLSLSHAIAGVFSSSSSPMVRFIATISVILSLYVFFNTFFFFFPLRSSSYSPRDHVDRSSPRIVSLLASDPMVTIPPGSRKVRVYMYDLPRKFTYGVIESYLRARGVLKKPSSSMGGGGSHDGEVKYPGNQHSAEWCLFADLNKEEKDRINSPVVRVFDPEEAELFYVPFFSSLSLLANPIRPNGVAGGGVGSPEEKVYSDEEMQENLIEWLEGQVYWKRNNGRDHVFICQDPNALYKVVDKIKNAVLLVSDFGRLKSDQASWVKDVILPYSHRIRSFDGEIGVQDRKSLLFFMGNRYRKEGGKIRNMLFQVLENEEGVVMKHGAQSRESRRAATQGMHTSKFCLHPAGDTPSACRLFDAIVSLCVPVVVSDDIELPFEDVIDYHKIAIFVDSASAVKQGFLVNLLKAVSTDTILAYQQEIKKVKHYFEYDDPNGTVKEIWRQVSLKLPFIKLMMNRDKRLVNRELSQLDCSCICSNLSEIVKHSGTVTL